MKRWLRTSGHPRCPHSMVQDQRAPAKSASLGTAGLAGIRRFSMDLLRIVAAILLPPLGVFLQVGIGKHFWINILLTLLGYIPGIVHAVWVIAKY